MLGIKSVKPLYEGHNTLLEVTRTDNHKREVLDVEDSVAFLVLNEENDTFVFVSQFRSAVALVSDPKSGYILEVPAGHLKDGLTVEQTIVEELWEELRIKITEDMVKLITEDSPLYLSPGAMTEKMHLAVVVIRNKNIHEPEKSFFGLEEEGECTQRVFIPRDEIESLPVRDMKTWAIIQWFLCRVECYNLRKKMSKLEGSARMLRVNMERQDATLIEVKKMLEREGGQPNDQNQG